MTSTESSDGDLLPVSDEMSLHEFIEYCLGNSMVIFLLADLRLLSATGRLNIAYRHFCVDGDRSFGRENVVAFEEQGPLCLSNGKKMKGLRAVHLIAIVLLEVIYELRNTRPTEATLRDLQDKDPRPKGELEIHSSLQQWSFRILDHLSSDGIRVQRVDPVPKQESVHDDDSFCLDQPQQDEEASADFQRQSLLIRDDPVFHRTFQVSNVDESALESERRFQPIFFPMSKTLKSRMQAKQDALREQLAVSSVAKSFKIQGDSGQFYSREELITVLEKGVRDRSEELSGVLSQCFEQNSTSRILAQSDAEWLFLQDWHPQTECTYAIGIDRPRRRIILTFRGATTTADWMHAVDWTPIPHAINPISEDYPGKTPYLHVHGGFYNYLFRERKDTGSTKYDEIAHQLHRYMNQHSDDNEPLRLTVCGHSLGGALSCIFAFYASTDERFADYPVEALSFGMPYVGGYQYADAFRHQEQKGRLRMVRVHNVRDGIVSVPPTMWKMSKRGAAHFHVGIDVELPMIRTKAWAKSLFGEPHARIRYGGRHESFWWSYNRQFKQFYMWNFPMRFWKMADFHTLEEHYKRVLNIDPKKQIMARKTLGELYKMFKKAEQMRERCEEIPSEPVPI